MLQLELSRRFGGLRFRIVDLWDGVGLPTDSLHLAGDGGAQCAMAINSSDIFDSAVSSDNTIANGVGIGVPTLI